MHALVVAEPGSVGLAELPEPVPATDEVLIEPVLVGICGTDLDIVAGDIDPDFVRYPVTLGHEWVGRVVNGGGALTDEGGGRAPGTLSPLAAGTRVVVEGVVPCWRCAECVAGDTNRCATYDEIGFTRPGAAAERIAVPRRLVHPIADSVPDESAVLVEPASVVFRALTRCKPRPGQRVLVIGDGTIGLLATRLIRLWSPASVTVIGRRAGQAALVATAGADAFITDESTLTDGPAADGRFNLVIEAAGAAESVSAAMRLVGRGGTVALLGYSGQQAHVPMPVDDLINGDITLVASFSYTSDAWRHVVTLLNSDQLDLGFLITHRFPLADWRQAFDALQSPAGPRAKVVLERKPSSA